ncbi:chitobiase/beta-hexosaminidase C-terminal domain-containing protein [Methanobacterium sp.]|uniref:chitobiase/beta-hexosaminidase C-terminal domain-containing protein n=1 Tax=Methanobacterium sp. TaxID=2164 RepID=UPI003C760B4A
MKILRKYLLIIALTCIAVAMSSGTAAAAVDPIANFTANNTNGSAPLSVQFNDTSTGNPTSWSWSFGDGNTSILENPVHNYTKTGNFNVTLTVNNSVGSNSLQSTISVNNSPLSDYNNIYVQTANNGTYYIQNLGGGGGLNAVHIATNTTLGPNYGQYTNTTEQSGVFYATDTGGRGYQDDVILMIAVNGTLPKNFSLHITASGYTWIPNGYNTAPAMDNITYQPVSINETFYSNDFIYGPQNWKPAGGDTAYPIYYNEDLTDPSNSFNIMFIDLKAGLLGSNYPTGNGVLINYGAVKINYTFNDLQSLATFNIYAWNANTTHGAGAGWTNSILTGQTGGPSGYSVMGSTNPTAAFTTNVTKGIVPLNVQFTDQSTENPISWYWDFGDGTNSTEQNPTHIYTTPGQYTVTENVTNAYGSNQTTQNIDVGVLSVSSDLQDGSYNTTQTINLEAADNLYPNPNIYYTTDGSDPTTNSTLYNGPITLSNEGTTTLKFFAVDENNDSSDIMTNVYTIDKTAPTATANPTAGTYNTKQSITLNATDNIDPDPTIYYTTDGSDPTTSSTRSEYTSPILINTTSMLKYVTVDAAGNWSPIYSQSYNMVYTAAPVASASLPSGLYTTDQVVTLSAVDQLDTNPKIYYTLNGSNPTTKSALYDWPISINTIGTTIVKFIAVNSAGLISNVTTETYTLDKPGAGGTWNTTTIDNNGVYNSIAVDSLGNPHIAYYQTPTTTSNPDLVYAYKNSTGWHTQIVDSSAAGTGFYVSLALDSSNNPHMVYGEVFGINTTDKLKYAYENTTGWYITALTENSYISYINLVLYHDEPMISFYNDSANNGEGELQFMYNNGSGWIIDNVTPKPSGGRMNSLAVNSEGIPCISYYDIYSGPVQGSLRYAQLDPSTGSWDMTIVDGNMADLQDVGIWNSLALDSSGNPHISYNTNIGGGGGSLKYAYYNGTQWIISTVSTLKSSSSKLVLNSANSPIIVYEDVDTGDLKYAYQEGTNWIINNIDTINGVGQWISLTLSPSEIPTVSYSTANSYLNYAYLMPFNISANPTGGTFNTTKTVVLTSNSGTTIYYTKDGSDPRTSSTRVKYSGSLVINSTSTIKFAAVDSASNWSSISTSTYIINLPPTATTNIISGSYNTNLSVTLNMSGTGNIYYTTNGTTPTATSKKYTGPISITSTTNLKYLAINQAGQNSPVYTASYVIDKIPPKVVSTNPKNYQTGFSKTGTIAIRFSENIKPSVNWSKIYTKNLTTGKVTPITISITGNTMNIRTTKTRNPNNWYEVIIPAYSIKDIAGNMLSQNYIFRFKSGK